MNPAAFYQSGKIDYKRIFSAAVYIRGDNQWNGQRRWKYADRACYAVYGSKAELQL